MNLNLLVSFVVEQFQLLGFAVYHAISFVSPLVFVVAYQVTQKFVYYIGLFAQLLTRRGAWTGAGSYQFCGAMHCRSRPEYRRKLGDWGIEVIDLSSFCSLPHLGQHAALVVMAH